MKIGIDLGTTNTVVCYENDMGNYEFIRFGNSEILPSVVYVDENNNTIVGTKALTKGSAKPSRLIRSAKRHMKDNNWKYPDSDSFLSFEKTLTPAEVGACILKEVKRVICRRLLDGSEDEEIEAVITVPAYFASTAIKNTKEAAKLAGMKIITPTPDESILLPEPSSAAIAYINDNISTDTEIFVVDFGGGTFDLSYLKYKKDINLFDPVATGGNDQLGGDDIDKCLLEYFKKVIFDDYKIDLTNKETSGLGDSFWQVESRLRNEAKLTKHKLSEIDEVDVSIDALFKINGRTISFETSITRAEFEKICEKDIFTPMKEAIIDMIKKNKIDISRISRVLLVGGTCYIPKVRKIVEEIFDGRNVLPADLSNVVALGAAIVANDPNIKVVNRTSYDLGVEIFDEKLNKCVFDTIIERDMETPCRNHQSYSTTRDNQKCVDINVYERGGNIDPNDKDLNKCTFYGSLTFDDFKKGKKGEPKFDIEFYFKSDRTLEIKVTDKNTNTSISTVLERSKKKVIEYKKSAVPTDLYLLIDASGSMAYPKENPAIENVKKAIGRLVNQMVDMSVHRVGVISFASNYKSICTLTHSKKDIMTGVNKLYASGGTNASGAFRFVLNSAESVKKRKSVVIMLTDGDLFDGNETAILARKMKENNITVVTIGEGSDVNHKFLKSISSVSSDGKPHNYSINTMDELGDIFQVIIDALIKV